MLKSNSAVTHSFKAHFPQTAWGAMTVIVVCFTVVAARKRDGFFRVVEVPFLVGVLCHAAYIFFPDVE